MEGVSYHVPAKRGFSGQVKNVQNTNSLNDRQTRNDRTFSDEKGDVSPDDWENDKFNHLVELMNVDCFDDSSFHRIQNRKKDILSTLDESSYRLPCYQSSHEEEIYFSPVSRHCGLFAAVEKAAEIAVNRHNQMKVKSLINFEPLKANYMWSPLCHFFFITLEATDASTCKKKTFRAGVYFPMIADDLRDVWCFKQVDTSNQGKKTSHVGFSLPSKKNDLRNRPSFMQVENNANEDGMDEEEEDDDDDYWETESYKEFEGTLPFDVFYDYTKPSFEHEDMDMQGFILLPVFKVKRAHLDGHARRAVDLYNKTKKKGGTLEFKEIVRANRSIHFSVSYYFIIKAFDTSTHVERCFRTNVLEVWDNDILHRVRVFKPEVYQNKESKESQTMPYEKSCTDDYDGWEDRRIKGLIETMDIDFFNCNSYDSLVEDSWIFVVLHGRHEELPSKDKQVYFSHVSRYCGLSDVVEDAAKFAIDTYNDRKGKNLTIHKVSNANYIHSCLDHLYFITLTAVDHSTNFKITFQTCVCYSFKREGLKAVLSFKPNKVNEIQSEVNDDEDFVDAKEDEDDGDGWETESYKNFENSLALDVFGDPPTSACDKLEFDLLPCERSLLDSPFMESSARVALEKYEKKEGRRLDFIEISKGNKASRLGCSLYYLTLKAMDPSIGVVRTFFTNVLESKNGVIKRVRAFMPEPLC